MIANVALKILVLNRINDMLSDVLRASRYCGHVTNLNS